jgi:hypothetical protein
MTPEMRRMCERCGAALAPADEAYICTFECTYCPACAHATEAVCPKCGGGLARRPRPASKPAPKPMQEWALGEPVEYLTRDHAQAAPRASVADRLLLEAPQGAEERTPGGTEDGPSGRGGRAFCRIISTRFGRCAWLC